MADEPQSENDKKVAPTEGAEKDPVATETPVATEVLDIEAAELDRALEDLTQISAEDLKTPRIKELLHSPDRPSRFMTILSIVFAVLAVVTFGLLVTLYLKHRAANKPVASVVEKVEVAPIVNEPLGEFKMVLGSDGPKEKQRDIRVDVVAECSNQDACNYLKDHIAEARDLVIPVLSSSTEEEFMNADSKNLIRRRIAERLNSTALPGKVLQIHFTDLTIEE